MQNIYVCPCHLAGAGRSPAKKILAVYPPSHGTSMHNPRLKSDRPVIFRGHQCVEPLVRGACAVEHGAECEHGHGCGGHQQA